MPSLSYPHKVVLLRSGFQYPERHLFFARARLYFDRLELTGWHLNEHHEEVIPLDQVDTIAWNDDQEPVTVELQLKDGRCFALSLSQPTLWKHFLDMRMTWSNSRPAFPVDRQPPSLKDLIAYSTSMS